MEEEMMRELEHLRAENKILRESLTVCKEEEAEANDKDCIFERFKLNFADACSCSLDKAKTGLEPSKEKLTGALKCQMEKNPVPLLVAGAILGFLLGRKLFK